MKIELRSQKAPLTVVWLIKGILAVTMRPGYPAARVSELELNSWLIKIQRQGVKSIINMLSEDEETFYYRDLSGDLNEYYTKAGFEVLRISVEEDGKMIKKAHLRARIISGFRMLPKPLLIHCNSGAERSAIAIDAICEFSNPTQP